MRLFHLPSKLLGNKEKRALNKLQTYTKTKSFPSVLDCGWNYHIRSYIPGQMLYNPSDKISRDYFLQAKSILREMRKLGVVNNELAKEANWLVKSDGTPAIVDFQLAVSGNLLGRKFIRLLAREDLRHLLKHKMTYIGLTAAEYNVVSNKSNLSRLYHVSIKKIYLFVTRKLMGWK